MSDTLEAAPKTAASEKRREAMNAARKALGSDPVDSGEWYNKILRASDFERAMKAVLAVKGLPSRDRKPDRVAHLVGSVLWWITESHDSFEFEELEAYCVGGEVFRYVFMAGYKSATEKGNE